jgi:hypothetical protein
MSESAQESDAESSIVGGVFAYRARSVDELVPVHVLKEGTKKPARVLVRFEDPAMEGREEWVPPARLKVRWDGVEAFKANEARWNAVLILAPRSGTPESYAAEEAGDLLIPDSVGSLWRGYLRVKDVPTLINLAGIDEGILTSHAAAFADQDDSLIVPWPVAIEIVKALLARNADPVLAVVFKEEAEARYEAVYGQHYSYKNHDRYIEPEDCAKYDNESSYGAPKRALLREWAGVRAERWDELIELRKEIKRVGDVAEKAIRELRQRGHGVVADRLATDLGMTVEMLQRPKD